ncbi:hypothetical protein PTQ21_24555 [Paenibacillus marchantiae]|uniref:hypothetical protein n=1 Tax=Paenibacillus marchantiae TaxID=3026433 RepID=UPI00237AA440|nr:hypothetical protein [Paenibacillus marchantiae]WDQ31537.1 hypothetical protein PTQ21_24555 [Paenibacillus marchantiae]
MLTFTSSKKCWFPIDDTFCNAYNQLLTDANCIIPPNRGIMQFADRGIIKIPKGVGQAAFDASGRAHRIG